MLFFFVVRSKPPDDSEEYIEPPELQRLAEIGELPSAEQSGAFYDFIEDLGDYHPALQNRPMVVPFARQPVCALQLHD